MCFWGVARVCFAGGICFVKVSLCELGRMA